MRWKEKNSKMTEKEKSKFCDLFKNPNYDLQKLILSLKITLW